MLRDTQRGSPSQDLALKMARESFTGNIKRIRELLAEGASVDGTAQLRPIVVATSRMQLKTIEFLLKIGADVNAPSYPGIHDAEFRLPIPGSRALHMASAHSRVDMVRVLLQAGANPNIVDSNGFTPLMAACTTVEFTPAQLVILWAKNVVMTKGAGLEIGRELLKAGADPLMTETDGYLALHMAASAGNSDLIGMLLSIAPRTVNRVTAMGETALLLAAKEGHAAAVDRLLSAGAKHPTDPEDPMCPLTLAVHGGYEEVVRVLIAKGSDTVGSLVRQLPMVVLAAVIKGHAGILHRVLTAARVREDQPLDLELYGSDAGPVLHSAAGFGVPTSVRFLLAEGANETVFNGIGELPRHVVGTMDVQNSYLDFDLFPAFPKKIKKKDPVLMALILRLLAKGPAFRARSWAWPAGPSSSPSAAAAAAAANTVSKGAPLNSALSARLLRPNKDMKFFVKGIGRHARKK